MKLLNNTSSKIISNRRNWNCVSSDATCLTKNLRTGYQSLDWDDPWHNYVKTELWKYLTQDQINTFYRDAAYWTIPVLNRYKKWPKSGIYHNIMDLDKNDYYIARNADGSIQMDASGNAIYKYHDGTIVDFSKIEDKRESFLWLFSRKSKRMLAAPIWYNWVKKMFQEYVQFMIDHWYIVERKIRDWNRVIILYEWELSERWINVLNNSMKSFFNRIESGDWPRNWWNVFYRLIYEWSGNHWMLLNSMMWNNFSRVLSDNIYANKFFWRPVTEENKRLLAEAMASMANRATGWHVTILDVMGEDWQAHYWELVPILFEAWLDWTMERVNKPGAAPLSKDYLMKLSLDQQIEQVYAIPGIREWSLPSRTMLAIKTKAWYNWRGKILRLTQFLWNSWLLATLMSIGSWIAWLMPLLILNSCMFVTDKIAMNTRLDWDWESFINKWGLDWAKASKQSVFEKWLGNTLLDTTLKCYNKVWDAVSQWLFNIWDMFMEDSYRVRQMQQFFESRFPWIKDIAELDEAIERMVETQGVDAVERMLRDCMWYVDYSVRNATTNTPISQWKVTIHAAKNVINQPITDTFIWLWHFFSWWWRSKIKWALTIIKDWMGNIMQWRIGPAYLDKLASTRTAREADALLRKAYLENEDLIYFFHKIYTSYIISKYLYRLSGTESMDDWWTVFDSFSDMKDYLSLFAWDLAALESVPEWKVFATFFNMLMWQMFENDQHIWTWISSATMASVKEATRIMFRKLYIPLMWTEYVSMMNRDWDLEESVWLPHLIKSVQDNANAYMFFLKDEVENWNFEYYIPKWPNMFLNDMLGIQPDDIKFISEQQNLKKYANLFNSETTFNNWLIYNFPFMKQWNVWQFEDTSEFINDLNDFRWTQWYIDLTNNKLPSDMDASDYEYIYNVITWRILNQDWAVDRDTLYTKYSFIWEDWEESYNKDRQVQERIMHLLMKNGIKESEIKRFSEIMNNLDSKYVDEAIRTLAYVEAQSPWEWLQALAYIMNSEFVREVYWNKPKDRSDEEIKNAQEAAKIKIAKKYWKYIPEIDRYFSWQQIILHYAKEHDTPIAKYISGPWDNNASKMSLHAEHAKIDPATGKPRTDTTLKQNFQAQLMVDIMGAAGNPDARKLMNWFSLIFKTWTYEEKDWSFSPEFSNYCLEQLETVYDHIDHLAVDETTKHILKQWTLMFWDRMFPYVANDPVLSKRDDVKRVLNDWVHYWYTEFWELDNIAIEYAEDQIANAEYKKNGSKYSKYGKWWYQWLFSWWYDKKFKWFDSWYDHMKKSAYSKNYTKYRIYDWIPKEYNRDYLKENEYKKIKDQLIKNKVWLTWGWSSSWKKSSWNFAWNQQDDGVWFTLKRGKALQFYKREDIDKPVEYKTPWRKRWVKRWSWVKPISTTTWKHLTPTPK